MNAPKRPLKYGNLQRYLLKVMNTFAGPQFGRPQYEQDPVQKAELLEAAAAKRKRRQERNLFDYDFRASASKSYRKTQKELENKANG